MSDIQDNIISGTEDFNSFSKFEEPAQNLLDMDEKTLNKTDLQENVDDFSPSSTPAVEDLLNFSSNEPSQQSNFESLIETDDAPKPESKQPEKVEVLPESPVASVSSLEYQQEGAFEEVKAPVESNNIKKTEEVEEVSSTNNEVGEEKLEDLQLKSPLASWMQTHQMSPAVMQLIYWKDVKKSALVFTTGLALMMSLQCCSIISVLTTVGLSLLLAAFLYRIGMTIVNAVQKTSVEHPFKKLLEEKVELPEETIQQCSLKISRLINSEIKCLQKLFLIDDVIESLKFGVLLWLISYVGGWFSLFTLLILAFVGVFTIPKLYEEKQAEIDKCIGCVRSKMCEIYGIIEAKIPEKVKAYICKKDKKE